MSWGNVVQTVGKWYESNIHNYSQTQYSRCSISNTGNVRHDCSGYVSACLRAAGIISQSQIFRSGDFLPSGSAATLLRRAGFTPLTYNISGLQAYDIIAYNGHVEIYAGTINGTMRSWSWGSCHDGLNGNTGMPAYTSNKSRYAVMWRIGGNAAAISNAYVDTTTYTDSTTYSTAATNNYATYSSEVDESVFSTAIDNAYSPTTTTMVSADSSDGHRTRIYKATDSTIRVDELSMPLNEGTITGS